METRILPIIIALIAGPCSFASDPDQPGKSGTSTASGKPAVNPPATVPAEAPSNADKDFGKAGTSTSQSAAKEHGDKTVDGTKESAGTPATTGQSGKKTSAEQQSDTAKKAADASDAAGAAPVGGNNNTTGGEKASK